MIILINKDKYESQKQYGLAGKYEFKVPVLRFYLFCNLFYYLPVASGGSQARGRIRATTAGLHHSHSNGRVQTTSATYTIVQGNARSLTH